MAHQVLLVLLGICLFSLCPEVRGDGVSLEFVERKMKRMPGRLDDLEVNLTSNAETLSSQGETMSKQAETLSSQAEILSNQAETISEQDKLIGNLAEQFEQQCETIQITLNNNLRSEEYSHDPPPEENEVIQLSISETKQDTSNSVDDNSGRAVDGNTASSYGSGTCTHTDINSKPHWWQGTLQYKSNVTSVTVYNRGDCCGDRLKQFTIKGFENDPGTNSKTTGGHRLAYQHDPVATAGSKTINCETTTPVRYIRIQKSDGDTSALTLCEVYAFGVPVFDFLRGSIIQSSHMYTRESHSAWRAMDGDKNTCSETNKEEGADPWWQIDFGKIVKIISIDITNINDNKYAKWLHDFEVAVFETLPLSGSCADDEVVKHTCATQKEGVPKGETVSLACEEPVAGQYVKITKKNVKGEALILCEVDIYKEG